MTENSIISMEWKNLTIKNNFSVKCVEKHFPTFLVEFLQRKIISNSPDVFVQPIVGIFRHSVSIGVSWLFLGGFQTRVKKKFKTKLQFINLEGITLNISSKLYFFQMRQSCLNKFNLLIIYMPATIIQHVWKPDTRISLYIFT